MYLTKDDIERIIENSILNNLKLEIDSGHFTDPNSRLVTLLYKDKEINRIYIDIKEKPEYDG